MSEKLVPKLRFKADDGSDFSEWERKKLGDIAKIQTGNSNKEDMSPEGDYVFFDRSLDILRSTKYLFDCDAIIVPGEGASFPARIFKGKFDLHQRAYAITEFKKASIVFIAYHMNYSKRYFERYAVGSTVKSLRLPIFREMSLFIPSLPEQEKIADFLTAVDKRIELLSKKHKALKEYKKGLMQKIFSQEIRFKADNGSEFSEWERKRLGEVIEHQGGRPLEKYVSKSAKYKFISIGNYSPEGRYIDNNSRIDFNGHTSERLLNKNDLVMVLNDKTSSGEIIGATILIEEDDKYIFNQRSERISVDYSKLNPKFIWFLFNSKSFRNIVFSLAQGGTQIYINFSSLKKENIVFPSLPEQQKIADFLTVVDNKIEKLEVKIQKTKEFKKGLLQQMFV